MNSSLYVKLGYGLLLALQIQLQGSFHMQCNVIFEIIFKELKFFILKIVAYLDFHYQPSYHGSCKMGLVGLLLNKNQKILQI